MNDFPRLRVASFQLGSRFPDFPRAESPDLDPVAPEDGFPESQKQSVNALACLDCGQVQVVGKRL